MAAPEQSLAPAGSPAPSSKGKEGADPSSGTEGDPAGSSSTPEAPPSIPNSSNPSAAVPEADVTSCGGLRRLDLPVGPAPQGPAPLAEASPALPSRSWRLPARPETFRQRFRQFRYQDAAGPQEAFRQLRELSRASGCGPTSAQRSRSWNASAGSSFSPSCPRRRGPGSFAAAPTCASPAERRSCGRPEVRHSGLGMIESGTRDGSPNTR